MLSNEEIAENMLNDLQAYREYVKEFIIGRLMDSTYRRVYWDAWFRGATGKDLENAGRGKVYKPRTDLAISKK
jgi:predicted transcriptional regulator